MTIKLLVSVSLVVLLASCAWSAADRDDGTIASADLILASEEFFTGDHEGVITTPDGLTLAPEDLTGIYTSPVIDAPLDYNALIPQ